MEEDFKDDKEYRKGIEKVKDLIYDEELGLLYDYEEDRKQTWAVVQCFSDGCQVSQLCFPGGGLLRCKAARST